MWEQARKIERKRQTSLEHLQWLCREVRTLVRNRSCAREATRATQGFSVCWFHGPETHQAVQASAEDALGPTLAGLPLELPLLSLLPTPWQSCDQTMGLQLQERAGSSLGGLPSDCQELGDGIWASFPQAFPWEERCRNWRLDDSGLGAVVHSMLM